MLSACALLLVQLGLHISPQMHHENMQHTLHRTMQLDNTVSEFQYCAKIVKNWFKIMQMYFAAVKAPVFGKSC